MLEIDPLTARVNRDLAAYQASILLPMQNDRVRKPTRKHHLLANRKVRRPSTLLRFLRELQGNGLTW